MYSLPPSTKRGKQRFICALLFSSSFFLGAADQIWTRHIAPRKEATGTIIWAKHHGGKNAYTDFELDGASGNRYLLRADSGSNDLQPGEQVHADWMLFNARVLHFIVLEGPHVGAHFQDAVPFESIVGPIFALWFGWISYRSWRKNPQAFIKEDQEPSPPSDVDDRSLLHL
jgi:hypothetical protein